MDVPPAADALLQRAADHLRGRRRAPAATYRLQFHAGFTFKDARAATAYLARLGVSHAYASPYLQARPGSRHGYDISDHRRLNPEVGTAEDYDAWIDELHRHGLGQVLDVVPNHMGIVGNANPWWSDVLENGRASAYADFFDIDWEPAKAGLRGRVLLPLLGEPYGRALEDGQIKLACENGAFFATYFEHRFPVAPDTYNRVLGHRGDELAARLGAAPDALSEYQSIQTAVSHLPPLDTTDPERAAERRREKEVVKRRLAALMESCPAARAVVEENVAAFNGPGDAVDRLDRLLDEQAYRLAWWRVAVDEINYRRFFDVNELAALRMEREEVFEASHELVLRLVADGKVDGLRIDHPDGLFDPAQYLERLQEAFVVETARRLAGPDGEGAGWPELRAALRARWRAVAADPAHPLRRPLYVVVEKILAPEEEVREEWATDGTTGYELLAWVNALFVDRARAGEFDRLYRRWLGEDHPASEPAAAGPFRSLVYRKKILILQVALSGELHVLAHKLDRLSERHRWSRDFTLNSLRHGLREVVAGMEVYRSYVTGPEVTPADRQLLERAVARARRRNPVVSAAVFDYVRDVLLHRGFAEAPADEQAERQRFVGSFQQLTAPVMAKGLEDTSYYVYNRLVSLNEVGGEPSQFGLTPEAFHQRLTRRRERHPLGLSATATHDTKRGEDVRARLNVLSEAPGAWQRAVQRWGRINRVHRQPFEEGLAPDRNDEYLLYQTLVGAWPAVEEGPEGHARFVERVQEYMQKAVHEAKVHTSWINPSPAYDKAIRQFVALVLDPQGNAAFLERVRAFTRRVAHFGYINALAQVLLKVAAPGVPDVYQGTELWDLSLVDPDNRRPVDYALRARLLDELDAATGDVAALARGLAEKPEDGRVKLFLLARALRCRKEMPELFTVGEYLPAASTGTHAGSVMAFVRRHRARCAVVVVPRLLTRVVRGGGLPLGPAVWRDTRVTLPGVGPRLRDVLTGATVETDGGGAALAVGRALAHFPVALLVDEG